MRTLLVLLPALLGADGGVSGAASGRPAAYVEARRAVVRALDAGALDAWPTTTRHLRVLEHAGLASSSAEAGGGCTVRNMLGWGS